MTVDRDEAIAEYDAFGPWVARVTSAALVPPLFRSWAPEPGTVDVMVKVPRTVHRRDTRPGAELYDHLLWVAVGTLVQLTRAGAVDPAAAAPEGVEGGVLRRHVALERVVAVEDSAELLDAALTLRLDDGTALSVGYSGTSRPVMAEVVAAVRAAWRPAPGAIAVPGPTEPAFSSGSRRPNPVVASAPTWPSPREAGPDVALVNELADVLRAEPRLVLLGGHGRRPVALAAPDLLGRLRERVQPWDLQGAVAAADAHELVLLHRRSWVTRTRRPELSMVRTVVSLDRVRPLGAAVGPSEYRGVSALDLGNGAARLLVPEGGDVERAVLGLVGAGSAPRAVCETLEP